jgi:hypothetical protein
MTRVCLYLEGFLGFFGAKRKKAQNSPRLYNKHMSNLLLPKFQNFKISKFRILGPHRTHRRQRRVCAAGGLRAGLSELEAVGGVGGMPVTRYTPAPTLSSSCSEPPGRRVTPVTRYTPSPTLSSACSAPPGRRVTPVTRYTPSPTLSSACSARELRTREPREGDLNSIIITNFCDVDEINVVLI